MAKPIQTYGLNPYARESYALGGGMTEGTSPNVVQEQDTGDYANVEENPQMGMRAQQLTAKATQDMKSALTGEFNKLSGSVKVGEAAEANAKNKAQTDLREKIGMMLYANGNWNRNI